MQVASGKIKSHNEWDKLVEIIVGTAKGSMGILTWTKPTPIPEPIKAKAGRNLPTRSSSGEVRKRAGCRLRLLTRPRRPRQLGPNAQIKDRASVPTDSRPILTQSG